MNNSDKEPAFNFLCPKQWNELDKTTSENVRFCSQCNKPVFLAANTKELTELARQKRCAAIQREYVHRRQVRSPDGSLMIGEPAPEPYSCLPENPTIKKESVFSQLCRKIRDFLGF